MQYTGENIVKGLLLFSFIKILEREAASKS